MRKKWHLTPEREAEMRTRYDSQTSTIDTLASEFDVPRWQIKKWAQLLGLTRRLTRGARTWTADELAYLEQNYMRLSYVTIARRLGRSLTAVSLKARRLKLRKLDEHYTASQVAIGLGVDVHKVVSWIKHGALKATRRPTLGAEERRPWRITDGALLDFLRRCPGEIDLRRVEQAWFLDLALNGKLR